MMHSKQRALQVLFLFILITRMAPVISTFLGIASFQSSGTDPFLYLGGARSILLNSVNPFNFFVPVYFYWVKSHSSHRI